MSDILRKLYESRLSHADLDSLKQQAEKVQSRRAESFKPRGEGETEDERSDTPYDLFMYSPEEILREKRFDAYTDEEL